MIRIDTYKTCAALVWQLKHSGAAVHADGGDIIQAGLPTGETVSIHLIESSIPPYEIRHTVTYNHAAGHYTLFILWCDMLLPPEGHVIETQPWEEALMALYGDRIYAYDMFGQEVFVFPVHYDRYGKYREIRYGETVSMKHLHAGLVEVGSTFLKGAWRIATFDEKHTYHRKFQADGQHLNIPAPGTLAAYYAVLGLTVDADPEAVKMAYRRLARKLHPDVNRASDATQQMQILNVAYRHIMEQFEDD